MMRVAILGGGIGAQHLAAYDQLEGLQVTHLVDQDTERCAALCGETIEPLATVEDALAADVDVIDICLPPHLHAPVAIAALDAGKHVICEKPLATSLAQVASIARAAEKAGKSVFPVFQYRFGPAFDRLTALQQAGLAGAPRAAALETHWNRDASYYAIPWRGTWAGEQGGAVLGHAIHAHDLLSAYMGRVQAVTARLGTLVNPIETDDTAALILELEGGALATSSITLGSAGDETRLRFIYEHLTATSHTNPYAPGEGGWQFTARDPGNQAAVDEICAGVPSGLPGFTGFLSEVEKALKGGVNHAVTLADGAESIALVTAIYASHRDSARVELPLAPDHPLCKGWLP